VLSFGAHIFGQWSASLNIKLDSKDPGGPLSNANGAETCDIGECRDLKLARARQWTIPPATATSFIRHLAAPDLRPNPTVKHHKLITDTVERKLGTAALAGIGGGVAAAVVIVVIVIVVVVYKKRKAQEVTADEELHSSKL
jgi:hypothetical protein